MTMSPRRSRDKEHTRQEILVTARRLFSEKGLHGTSIRDIELASGISKGLILHHFETKEKLYAAVQEELLREYAAYLAQSRPDISDMKAAAAAVVRGSFLYTRDHKEFRRIGLWSYLEGEEMGGDMENRFTLALIEAMRAGQKAGMVRNDIDALIMPFILKGAIDFWIRKKALIGGLAGDEYDMNALDEQFMDALPKLFMK